MKNKEKEKKYYSVKIIIVGNQSVGKTNIALRFVHGKFADKYKTTLGVDFLTYNLEYKDKIFKLSLMDTAGSEKFRSITRGYFVNCSYALVVYDITDQDSFNSIRKWIEDCQQFGNANIHMTLIGNKSDLINERKINTEDGKNLATEYNMDFFETSAKTGDNIENVFKELCRFLSDNIDEGKYDFDQPSSGIKIVEEKEDININKSFNENINLANNNAHRRKCCK